MFDSINQLRQYYTQYKKLNEHTPAILFSVNIETENIVSTKLYLQLTNAYDSLQLGDLLPTTEHYQKYIPYWCKDRDLSLCVGIKSQNNTCVYYLHIKFEDNIDVLTIDRDIERPLLNYIPFISKKRGISYEYNNGKATKKNYYYLHNRLELDRLSSLHDNINDVDHFEYTEIGSDSKVIVVYNNNEIENCRNYIKSLKNLTVHDAYSYMKKKYNLEPTLYGRYINTPDKHSLYWSFTTMPDLFQDFLRYEA